MIQTRYFRLSNNTHIRVSQLIVDEESIVNDPNNYVGFIGGAVSITEEEFNREKARLNRLGNKKTEELNDDEEIEN